MFIWSGRGGLIILIYFFIASIFQITCDTINGKEYWNNNHWVLGSAFLLTAVCVYFLNLKTDTKSRDFLDEKTGERFAYKPKHTLFFIPIKWWSHILASIGIYFIVNNILQK